MSLGDGLAVVLDGEGDGELLDRDGFGEADEEEADGLGDGVGTVTPRSGNCSIGSPSSACAMYDVQIDVG